MLLESHYHIDSNLAEPVEETINIIKGEEHFKEKLCQIN